MTIKLIPVITIILIFGAVTGCTKKADPEMEALKAQMQAMQAELDKAKSTNASAEEIAKLETAIATADAAIAEQEQQAEQRTTAQAAAAPDTTPSTTTTAAPSTSAATTTPAASTATTTAPASTATTSSARSLESLGTITNGHLTINNGATDTIVVIGEDANYAVVYSFANNPAITRVTIPNSVRTISGFQGCTNLTSVTFGSGVEGIMDQAFWNCKLGPSLTIPNGVVFIGQSAFENNQLTSVTLPNGLRDLGGFQENRLTGITIPNSVDRILDAAFRNNRLTALIIPNSVTNIGRYAFDNNQITHVTIPASVTSVGISAFIGNPLRSVTFERSGVQISGSAQQIQANTNVYGYAFNDGESLLEAYTQGGAGTYIYDSRSASSMQTRTGQTILLGGRWTKSQYNFDVHGNMPFQPSRQTVIENAALYAEPSTNARVIKTINAMQVVTVTGEAVTDSTGRTLSPVEHGGDRGWVDSYYFK